MNIALLPFGGAHFRALAPPKYHLFAFSLLLSDPVFGFCHFPRMFQPLIPSKAAAPRAFLAAALPIFLIT